MYSSHKFWLLREIFPCIWNSVSTPLLQERNKDELVMKLVQNTLYYFLHTTF